MKLMNSFVAVLATGLTVASGRLIQSATPTLPNPGNVDRSLLSSNVGTSSCETGSKLLTGGDLACFKDAQTCKVTTTPVTIGVNFGITVSVTIPVPTGCDQTVLYLPGCLGNLQYTVEGSGETKKIENTSCGVKQKEVCLEVNYGKWCTNIGKNGNENDIINWIVSKIGGLQVVNVTYDPATGNLCIDSDLMKKCKEQNPTNWPCGDPYLGIVDMCTP